ncbi:hypothetical protein AVEN_185739-1 [Araneus ventricosus]|uniref:Uncharacterized protein n=1 Tax=Araneus ventricosus TaxID=182803 RepID=A0A4Y2I2N7_ARAVE|nr:hypothetical protein AVEN_185739-1 [Araneus ventricosus]
MDLRGARELGQCGGGSSVGGPCDDLLSRAPGDRGTPRSYVTVATGRPLPVGGSSRSQVTGFVGKSYLARKPIHLQTCKCSGHGVIDNALNRRRGKNRTGCLDEGQAKCLQLFRYA